MYDIYPAFICSKDRPCAKSPGCGGDKCNHTTVSTFAKNKAAVSIYEEFVNTFDFVRNDTGEVIGFIEKEVK